MVADGADRPDGRLIRCREAEVGVATGWNENGEAAVGDREVVGQPSEVAEVDDGAVRYRTRLQFDSEVVPVDLDRSPPLGGGE